MSGEDTTAPGELDLATLRDGFAALACEPEAETGTTGDHPEPDTIYAAVHGELSPGALRDVVEHIAACPRCAEEWRLAMAFAEEAEEAEGAESPRRAAAPPRPALRLVPIAAALVVAVLAAGVWLTVGQSPEQTAPVYREAPSAGDIVSLLPEGVPLDREEPVLRWRLGEEGAPEGTTYDVLVGTRSTLEPVAEGYDLTEAELRIPAQALASLGTDEELAWRVEATLPDGSVVSSGFVTPLE
jgi:hypothetical protein